MKQFYESNDDVMGEVKKTYPNAKAILVCAFGIYYTIYKDDTYKEKIAESLYSNKPNPGTFTGVYLTLNWLIEKPKEINM